MTGEGGWHRGCAGAVETGWLLGRWRHLEERGRSQGAAGFHREAGAERLEGSDWGKTFQGMLFLSCNLVQLCFREKFG